MRSFFTLALLFFFYSSHAQTYYISATGSDAVGNGSMSSPWRTLYKAASVVKAPGSIIHVNAGTYIETEQVKLEAGVSVEGEGASSVIKSALTADWKEILSLRSEEGTNGNQHISNLKFDGQNLSTFWCIYISGRSNVSIYDCTITDFKDRGVIFNGRNDDLAAAPGIYATGNKFYNNTVSNCAAYNTANGIYGRGCLNIGGQDGMLIYNNNMVQNQRPKGFNGYLIKYQNDGYLKGVKIFNNTLTKIPFSGDFGGDNGWDFAIEFWNVLGGMEIYGNTIQGAVDIVNTSRAMYRFGIWIHDNKLGQPVLNSHFESGLIFEVSNESVIVEKNVFSKISGGILFYAQENTVLNDISIRDNRFEDIGRNTGNGNNGNGIQISAGTLLGNENHYTLSNLVIYNNLFKAAANNAPFYGIEITGAAAAVGIKVQKNTIDGFTAACIVANPARVIDSLVIENNILSGNGNNNDPFYIVGTPANYSFKNNSKSGSATGSDSGFSFRQQLLRPLYYEVKSINPLLAIAFLSFIIFIWFARKENIYAFPACILYAALSSFISFEDGHLGLLIAYFYYIGISIYGWMLWAKRDRKNHRIVRITSSAKKDWLIQLLIFGVSYVLIYAALHFGKEFFVPGSISIMDSFIYAASFTGLWAITRKKVESWYWWTVANAVAVPAYLAKHYLINSCWHVLLLLLSLWALYKWKRRSTRRRV